MGQARAERGGTEQNEMEWNKMGPDQRERRQQHGTAVRRAQRVRLLLFLFFLLFSSSLPFSFRLSPFLWSTTIGGGGWHGTCPTRQQRGTGRGEGQRVGILMFFVLFIYSLFSSSSLSSPFLVIYSKTTDGAGRGGGGWGET